MPSVRNTQAIVVHGRDQRAHVASSRPASSAAIAKENATGFDPPKKVTELSSTANDWQPQISGDGLTVVFASDRDGGKGGFDLWMAKRANATAPFSTPTALGELNTNAADFAGWLSADGCRIWFSSNRVDAGGNSSLYYAERPR